jgi:hypothetical protein
MAEPQEPLTEEELEQVEGEPLPERELMSVITTGIDDTMPVPAFDAPLKGGEQL